MKKLLFISVIILNLVGIFSLYSTALISQANAQQGNCKAIGSECNNDDKKCCSQLDRNYQGYKKGDPLTCGKQVNCPDNQKNNNGTCKDVCVVNKPVPDGGYCLGDNAHTSLEAGPDVQNGQTQGQTITLKTYEKCAGDSICNTNTAKCEPNAKCIDPKRNQNTNVKCKADTSSNEQNAATTCCSGFQCCNNEDDGPGCKGNVGTCVENAAKKSSCLTDKDTDGNPPKLEAKGDTTSQDYKDGTLKEGEVCCAKFQFWDNDKNPDSEMKGEQGGKCYNRETNKWCKHEGQDAKADATTKDVWAPSKKCCAGLKLIDGKCVKEVACLDEDSGCTVGEYKCCGEQSCIVKEGAKPDPKTNKVQGKCQEGLPFPPSPPCAQGKFQNGKCTAVTTAFGDLNTDPENFVQSIFGVMLAMSGGIALLLIMKSGYLIMTAQGKPEALQQARDQFIAAIVGLIFLIFSFVLLQVIGFEILKVPEIKIGQP